MPEIRTRGILLGTLTMCSRERTEGRIHVLHAVLVTPLATHPRKGGAFSNQSDLS